MKLTLADVWKQGCIIRINNFGDKEKAPHSEKDIKNQVCFCIYLILFSILNIVCVANKTICLLAVQLALFYESVSHSPSVLFCFVFVFTFSYLLV